MSNRSFLASSNSGTQSLRPSGAGAKFSWLVTFAVWDDCHYWRRISINQERHRDPLYTPCMRLLDWIKIGNHLCSGGRRQTPPFLSTQYFQTQHQRTELHEQSQIRANPAEEERMLLAGPNYIVTAHWLGRKHIKNMRDFQIKIPRVIGHFRGSVQTTIHSKSVFLLAYKEL